MIRPFEFNEAMLMRLATGHGGPEAVRLLRSSRSSRTLQLILLMLDTPAGGRREVTDAYDVLAQAHAVDRDAVSELLGYPWVSAWAAACVRQSTEHQDPKAALRLGGVAAVAAAQAGTDADVTLDCDNGVVSLPRVGVTRVLSNHVRAEIRSGQIHVLGDRDENVLAGDADTWWPIRRLLVACQDKRLSPWLDDCDPYRHCFGWEVSERIEDPVLAHWRHLLDEAWRIVCLALPGRADELVHGLCSLVPLGNRGPVGQSASSADAFGGCAVSLPRDAASLAEILVHEFAHSKLSAGLDLLPLHRAGDQQRFYAPWRPDPRPLSGLLHGCFAFLEVCELWSGMWERLDPQTVDLPSTQRRFAQVRAQVRRGMDSLQDAAGLLPRGREFAELLATRLAHLDAVAVDASVEAGAAADQRENEKLWRSRWA